MDLRKVVIAWNPNNQGENDGKQIKLVPLGSRDDQGYLFTWGGCNSNVAEADDNTLTRLIFIEAMSLIINSKLDPITVHNTLCEIKAYRDGLSNDSRMPSHLQEKFRKEIQE